MKRVVLLSLLVVGLALLCAVHEAAADCGQCAAGCTTVKSCRAKTGGCPMQAALAKLNLTDAQKKKIAAAKAQLTATLKKASTCGCPVTATKVKKGAGDAYKAAVNAALTPDQRKAFTVALAKKSATPTKAGCGSRCKRK